MEISVRAARSDDGTRLAAIAAAGASVADAAYLETLAALRARVLVAEIGGSVQGFGGVLDVEGTAMLTDLFVDPSMRGRGVGTALLDALFEGADRRMTFSSKHEAAWAAYRRAGLRSAWRLLYLDGTTARSDLAADLEPGPWRHPRRELVEHLAERGATVGADVVVLPVEAGFRIARLCADDPVAVLRAALATLPPGSAVSMCSPADGPLARWALANGFDATDHDTFFATPGVDLPPELQALDPGLA